MIANHPFKPHPPRLRPVEHTGVRHFKLAEGQRIAVAGTKIRGRERRRQAMHPTPEKTLHGLGAEALTDLLQRSGVLTRPEAIIQRLVSNAGVLKLPLGPFMTVEPQPNRKRRIRVGLPERPAPLRVPEVEVEMVDERHFPPPVHVRMRPLLLALPGLRAPDRRFLLADADQDHAVFALACRGFQVGPGDRFLVLALLELHHRNLVLVGKAVDRLHIRVANLAERGR